MQVKINNHTISRGSLPFIVGEAGINHNGEIEKAFEMIRMAKKVGLSAIKFQTFKAEEFVSDPKLMFTYKSQGKEITESMLDMFKRYEFSHDEWFQIKKKCDDEQILFLSTPQNRSDLDLLLELGIPIIKVGSDDFTNLPLLKSYASTGLPIILSCGMADLAEVYESLNTIGTLDGYPTILLLTTTQYPTPPKDVNLRKLETLSNAFPTLPLGLSDHTEGHLASSLAVAFGASFFEKHFTLDRNLPGPDHWFAEDPSSLRGWVNSVNMAYEMMGDSIIRPTQAEQHMKILARRSIIALCDIMEGDTLDKNNIGLRRPGNGLPPKMLTQVLGLKAVQKIKQGTLIKFGDFA